MPRPAVPELVRSSTPSSTRPAADQPAVRWTRSCTSPPRAPSPCFACNPFFDEFLGDLPVELLFASDDDADLARVLRAFAEADADRGEATGRELRRRVEAGHSIDSWADAVVATVRRLRD